MNSTRRTGTLLLLLAAAPAAAATPRHAAPNHAAAPSVRSITATGGTPQRAKAYAATNSTTYLTVFPTALVVRVAGPAETVVRYRCVSEGCRFAPSEQPDEVERVDPSSYDVKSKNGVASIVLTLSTDALGQFAVEVRTQDPKASRPGVAAHFVLVAQ